MDLPEERYRYWGSFDGLYWTEFKVLMVDWVQLYFAKVD